MSKVPPSHGPREPDTLSRRRAGPGALLLLLASASVTCCADFKSRQVRGSLDVACREAAAGCDWRGPQPERAEHEKTCVYHRVKTQQVTIDAQQTRIDELAAALTAQRADAMLDRRYLRIMQEKKDCLLHPLLGYEMIWRQHPGLPPHNPEARALWASDLVIATRNPDWICGIPGPVGSDWEGGLFPLRIYFPSNYPIKPPRCKFPEGFFHTNVFPSGTVCTSTLNEDQDWMPCISMREILQDIQSFFLQPNPRSPAQEEAYRVFCQDSEEYRRRVKEQAQKYTRAAFFADERVSGFDADRRDWAQHVKGLPG